MKYYLVKFTRDNNNYVLGRMVRASSAKEAAEMIYKEFGKVNINEIIDTDKVKPVPRPVTEAFEVHDSLNAKLFDTTTNVLLPEVRRKLIEIVNEFENYIGVPIDILDIQLVGSNASYNYTATSDLDVHIIANFDSIDSNKEILQLLYNDKKAQFNKNLNVSIKGIDIEIYVQDVKSSIVSNGIYSVCDNTWIKEPKPIKSITKHNTEKELSKWGDKIAEVIAGKNYEQISNVINSLYLMRTNSLAADGEYGKGNQLFKDIRSQGWLTLLKDEFNSALSKKLSLEQLSTKGQFINRYED